MRSLLVALSLLCAIGAHAEDVTPTADRTIVTVHVRWLTQDGVKQECAALGAWGGVAPRTHHIIGCNAFDHSTNTVTIYTTKPREVDDAYTTQLGHELLHALAGEYHQQAELH